MISNSAPCANPVFFRTYSRETEFGLRENWSQVCDRTLRGLMEVSGFAHFTQEEVSLLDKMQRSMKCLPSGRWLWIGGTNWLSKSTNTGGAYNCTSTNLVDWESFGLMMDLAMMGCGTGAVIEPRHINQLPTIRNHLDVIVQGRFGGTSPKYRNENTQILINEDGVIIYVGDSREGWVKSYQTILELSSNPDIPTRTKVIVDINDVRDSGEPLRGFGGVANPVKLPDLYIRCASILNKAVGRQLSSTECCLLIDEAAITVVAGNIRRSAGIRQFISEDIVASQIKDDLWQQDNSGNWKIDPERDALRMANHTRIFHHKPTLQECIDSVQKQYYSGEGAIQWAGEAIARANADLFQTPRKKIDFLNAYENNQGRQWIQAKCKNISEDELEHRLDRYGLNPCAEIIGSNFFCNLAEIHLNLIDPNNYNEQKEAFKAGALFVSALLHHKFTVPRYKKSRELDPIVGVSLTGLFDFFVKAFGIEWLEWWQEGRPNTRQGCHFKDQEKEFLFFWKNTVRNAVWEYCDRHKLKIPNRCTTVQPAGTKSLLTGASPGWHPPKATRFIRRITFRKNDPVALACLDYGYNVIPSQSDKDENGNLLHDPFDSRCTEWLVEIPVATPWADLPGADNIDISRFSALAQFDFYMQVQKYYSTHNTSATIELREGEIEALGTRIYTAIQKDEGYISTALLARFDDKQTYPRLPFEPIDKHTYKRLLQEVQVRRKSDDFYKILNKYNPQITNSDVGPAACDSDKCLFA